MKTPPAFPKPAATLIFLRDGSDGLETFMLLRDPKAYFAPGALVFPGGRLDEGDRSKVLRDYSDGASDLADDRFSLYMTAIREAFEECGILLARPVGERDIISQDRLKSLQPYRDLLNRGKISFGEFLKSEKIILACDRLTPFAHWITPEKLPVRYDTFFFLAKAPLGHPGLHDGYESVDSFWTTPKKLIEKSDAGKYFLMFPTRTNAAKLGESNNVKDAIAAARSSDIITVMPVVEKRKTGTYVVIPQKAGYTVTEGLLAVP
ncbi:MAG TPA: NUDIX hydrolase [Desulfobacteraceae bacterium]|nr:NUDIX hydrolase [Desulfobacteraceae bacterium]